jgi:hypothetical protein
MMSIVLMSSFTWMANVKTRRTSIDDNRLFNDGPPKTK